MFYIKEETKRRSNSLDYKLFERKSLKSIIVDKIKIYNSCYLKETDLKFKDKIFSENFEIIEHEKEINYTDKLKKEIKRYKNNNIKINNEINNDNIKLSLIDLDINKNIEKQNENNNKLILEKKKFEIDDNQIDLKIKEGIFIESVEIKDKNNLNNKKNNQERNRKQMEEKELIKIKDEKGMKKVEEERIKRVENKEEEITKREEETIKKEEKAKNRKKKKRKKKE